MNCFEINVQLLMNRFNCWNTLYPFYIIIWHEKISVSTIFIWHFIHICLWNFCFLRKLLPLPILNKIFKVNLVSMLKTDTYLIKAILQSKSFSSNRKFLVNHAQWRQNQIKLIVFKFKKRFGPDGKVWQLGRFVVDILFVLLCF